MAAVEIPLSMRARRSLAWGVVALHAICAAAADPAAPPAAKYYWKTSNEQSSVVTATFVGGKGHEWLVSGGWQPDGSVILAGNLLGPTLELGAPAEVIGADAPAPAVTPPPEIILGDRAQPFVIWNLPNVTGFLVKCEPDLKKVVSVHRLPWTAGVITAAAIDSSGAVYLAGTATEKIELLIFKQTKAAVAPAAEDKRVSCETFVARISPDLKRCDWIHRLQGSSGAPQLRLLQDGALWVNAQDIRIYTAAGALLRNAPLPAGLGWMYAVNPVDGLIAKGSNRGNWSTGREPWKCPGIRIVRPDGADLYQLYEWNGPYVGLDNHRSVADTTVGALSYDYAGNLLCYTWSDGGNEVMRFRSTDIRRPHGCRGLDFHWGGTGFNVVKLDGRDYQTIGSTKWRAETGHGAGLMRMSTLAPLADGAVCIAGTGGDRGVHETSASLMPEGPTGGNYVTVLSSDLSLALFGTMVGGAGEINLGNGAWGAVSGLVNGKRKHLLLTGAKEMNETHVLAKTSDKTPVKNAMQNAFGGGALDGYTILLDVPAVPAEAAPRNLPAGFQRLTVEAAVVSKKGLGPPPAEDQAFEFLDSHPKFVTADAEFRHAADDQALCEPMDGRPQWSQTVVKDGVSFSVRPVRPVFGLNEELAFELLTAGVAGNEARVPALKWELLFENGRRCRKEDAAARELPAATVPAGKVVAAAMRIAPSGLESAPSEGAAKAGSQPALPLGAYRVHFLLQPAAGAEIATKPVEFRVRPYWPNFMFGKSVSGQLALQKGKWVGAATVRCSHWVQVNGDQSRRVLGELVHGKAADAFPPVVFTISELGETQEQEVRRVDEKGRTESRWLRYSVGKGKLELADRTVEVRAKCVLKVQNTLPDNGAPGVAVDAYFTLKGRDLGLKRLAEEELDARIGMRGTFPKGAQVPAKAANPSPTSGRPASNTDTKVENAKKK